MTDSEEHATRDRLTAEFTLAHLFATVIFVQIIGIMIVHSYVLFETGGPSTFGTLRTVWIGGIVLTVGILGLELLS